MMLSRLSSLLRSKIVTSGQIRSFSVSSKKNAKVLVAGAGGGIGQPLSLLLKFNPLILRLSLTDVVDINGVSADLSHIDTASVVTSHDYNDFNSAIKDTDLVCIAAGRPRKPGMTRDDLFKINADIIGDLITKIFNSQSNPHIAIITNPVNSIMPFAFHLLTLLNNNNFKKFYKKIYGITCLDSVRACTFYAQHLGLSPSEVVVPVIGGHSDTTMVPLFSLSNHPLSDVSVAKELTKKIREAGTKVVEAKKGAGSATLSMAYAANRFVNAILEAHYGKKTGECAFVASMAHKDAKFFAEQCVFDANGYSDTIPLDLMSDYENELIQEILPILKADIDKGLNYAEQYFNAHKK